MRAIVYRASLGFLGSFRRALKFLYCSLPSWPSQPTMSSRLRARFWDAPIPRVRSAKGQEERSPRTRLNAPAAGSVSRPWLGRSATGQKRRFRPSGADSSGCGRDRSHVLEFDESTSARSGGARTRASEVVKERPRKEDELNAASRLGAVCPVELVRFPCGYCVVWSIGAPVFDVLDERAQLWQNLASARIV